jgi:hypothetical protein
MGEFNGRGLREGMDSFDKCYCFWYYLEVFEVENIGREGQVFFLMFSIYIGW